MERCLVLWFPDWPVTALLRESPTVSARMPIAVVERNEVIACSGAARDEGVRRGMRRRDAQAKCPTLRVLPHDPQRDLRQFLPVVDRIEEYAPGVQVLRAGLCVLRMRGAARYYGGELPAARALVGILRDAGYEVRAGVADGTYTAEQAARGTSQSRCVLIVPEGEAAGFLAPLPVTEVGDADLSGLLLRLGVRTLGDFAALDADKVRDRFGEVGARLHALAAGEDSRRIQPRSAPPELARQVEFEPALHVADQVAFGVRIEADRFVSALAAAGLVCTELRVGLDAADGAGIERVWGHPASFDSASVVDRVRWQLESAALAAASSGSGGRARGDARAEGAVATDALRGGIVRVRLEPEAVDAIAHHEPGLFGRGPDERVHAAVSRVQAMLGHRGVLTPVLGGGRRLADRTVLVPWGDRPAQLPARDRPWPGRLPPPYPATVFSEPRPVRMVDGAGAPVAMGPRGLLLVSPEWLDAGSGRRRVVAWAGPWPLVERGWDPAHVRRSYRFQAVDDQQQAWLLLLDQGEWSAEGRYD